MKNIDDFTQNDYRFLMNGYDSAIQLVEYGDYYPTVEHAYQASKTNDIATKKLIRNAISPREAKRIGRNTTLISDWNNNRETVMYNLLNKKFAYYELRIKLLDTQNATLISGGDKFWGVIKGVGENKLGLLLMKIRSEIAASIDDNLRVSHRKYLIAYGWNRNVAGDGMFTECWTPYWDNECFFDLESAVRYQSKISLNVLNTTDDTDGVDDADVDDEQPVWRGDDDDDDDDDIFDIDVEIYNGIIQY